MKLLTAVPTRNGLTARVWGAIGEQTAFLDPGSPVHGAPQLYLDGLTPLQAARRRILQRAIKEEFDLLWMLDDDIMPERSCLATLIKTGATIVSGIYRTRNPPFPEAAGGLGCTLVRLKEMPDGCEEWFADPYTEDLHFFRKAKEHNVDAFVNRNARASHWSSFEITADAMIKMPKE